jgi:hypothetical protein
VVVLRDCRDSLKAEGSSCTEAYLTSSYDNQVICVKVEPVTDAEEEDLLQIACPTMKCAREVNCVRIVIINTGHKHLGLCGIGMLDRSST